MKILLQRVTHANVRVAGKSTGEITAGLLLFAGFGRCDEDLFKGDAFHVMLSKASSKIVNLRVFPNSEGKLDHSVTETEGGILLVPQFTLYGKSEKGRRPDFTDAMQPAMAEQAFSLFHKALEQQLGKSVATGIFGADMAVSLVNDGPFTLQLTF